MDGCRAVEALRREDNEAAVVPIVFAALSSELDDVPGTASRHLWQPEALAEKLEKMKAQEADVLEEVRRLLEGVE